MLCRELRLLGRLLLMLAVALPASAANIQPNSFAWGENIGWFNFVPTSGPGVTVSDNAITGFAWSENFGWVNFQPTSGGVVNDGAGVLSGFAWSENAGWTGSFGIGANSATGCRIVGIGAAAGNTGAAVGVNVANGATISNCFVFVVGSTASTISPSGIVAETAHDCIVEFIGNAASSVGTTGILAAVVSNCRAGDVVGGSAGATTGISAKTVSFSDTSFMSQTGSSGALSGISANVVVGCHVDTISGSSSAAASGINGASVVHDCEVTTITNTGTGGAFGLIKTNNNAGSVENCVFRSCGSIAVSVGARQRIVGCNISSATTAGILATDVRNVIDGNNIDNCPSGIKVASGSNTANALVIRNQVRNCTTNFTLDAPCQSGPIVSASGTIASTSPWANFTD